MFEVRPGAEVVLVASPGDGSTFVGWSGAGCSGTQSCIVTMNADETVTATFLQPGHGTLAAPVPKTRRHRQIRAKITMGWRWDARRTVLTRGRRAERAQVTILHERLPRAQLLG
jgi:Divergent InlB B-repeat domain